MLAFLNRSLCADAQDHDVEGLRIAPWVRGRCTGLKAYDLFRGVLVSALGRQRIVAAERIGDANQKLKRARLDEKPGPDAIEKVAFLEAGPICTIRTGLRQTD